MAKKQKNNENDSSSSKQGKGKKGKQQGNTAIGDPVPKPPATFKFCPGSDPLEALKVILMAIRCDLYLTPLLPINLLQLNTPTLVYSSPEGNQPEMTFTSAPSILEFLATLCASTENAVLFEEDALSIELLEAERWNLSLFSTLLDTWIASTAEHASESLTLTSISDIICASHLFLNKTKMIKQEHQRMLSQHNDQETEEKKKEEEEEGGGSENNNNTSASKTPLALAVTRVDAFFAENTVGQITTSLFEAYTSLHPYQHGLQNCMKSLFTLSIVSAFPYIMTAPKAPFPSVVTRNNRKGFHYQCNSAMGLHKALNEGAKKDSAAGYFRSISPYHVATILIDLLPLGSEEYIAGTDLSGPGFINISLAAPILIWGCSVIMPDTMVGGGYQEDPSVRQERDMELIHSHLSNVSINRERRCVGVDFSSPNIAKEMHVGHLRSTIIGDTTCRILEWLGDEVYRINHVGDWGTQFGMLISYLQEEYGSYVEAKEANQLNFSLSDLTGIYQASKKRFDDDEDFKERSRLNVVKLQSGEEDPRNWWGYLCEISRLGFSEIYDRLGIEVEEMGESFYQEMIPSVIAMLSEKEEEKEIVDEKDEEGNVLSSHVGKVKLVEERDGALLIHCDNYDYPLFLRKSDGGFGYDSTDLAAIYHRIHNMKCDELIYITDAGQGSHFDMIFDVAKRMDWHINPITQEEIRINHIGFGVVCGENGKKFSTRAGKSVKLIDLLNESQSRIEQQLQERIHSTDAFVTCQVKEEDVPTLSADMGYAGIKYFDLKQAPQTSYVFNFDKMLDVRGDTAIYLMYAYARLNSIIDKARETKGVDVHTLHYNDFIELKEEAELNLFAALLQLSDIIRLTLQDLTCHLICNFLYDLSTKFSDFVTNCIVIKDDRFIRPRLLICEATRRMMKLLFHLLGINPPNRI